MDEGGWFVAAVWDWMNKNIMSYVHFILECTLRWVLASFLFLWMIFFSLNLKWSMIMIMVSLTCVSVSMREVATSKRLGLDRYLLSLNWFSSSSSCWLVKAVRGLRHFPNRPDWGPAGGGRAKLSVFGFMWVDELHLQCTVISWLISYLISAHRAHGFLCLTQFLNVCFDKSVYFEISGL